METFAQKSIRHCMDMLASFRATEGELKEGYERVWEKMERIHEAKYNPERYLLLEKSGIQTTETPEAIYIRHTGYPQLMLGLEYLCKAPESRYKFMNYLRLDYKNAYLPAPLVKDILETLPEQSAGIVREREENLRGFSVKVRIRPLRGIVSDFKWKVEYSCKSNRWVQFGEEKRRICGMSNRTETINPKEEDVENAIRVLRMYRN